MTTLTTPDTTAATRLITLTEALPADCVQPGFGDVIDAHRAAALQSFNEAGLPTRRHEEWRYTNLKPIATTTFSLPGPSGNTEQVDVDDHAITHLRNRLVFVNGCYSERHSQMPDVPDTVCLTRLEPTGTDDVAQFEQYLTKLAPLNDYPFTALNTALFNEVVAIHVPQGVVVDEPIYVLSIVTGDTPLLTSPRTVIVADDNAQVTVVEDFVSLGDAAHFSNAVTEIALGVEADVRHYVLERENANAMNISTLRSTQADRSRLSSHTILLGGTLVRNNVHPSFEGESCWSLLNGIYIGDGSQHLDNHMRVEHNAAHCDSRQFYKGILSDTAHGVFSGRIVVAPGAQKTDAVQSSQGLLLSEQAQVQNMPQLEIYADDVKCTHGSTVGQLDEDGLFYLRSRGLSEEVATSLMTFAFLAESLNRIEHDALRTTITDLLLDKLPDSRTLERFVLGA